MSRIAEDDDFLEVESLSDHYPSYTFKNDRDSEVRVDDKLSPEEINEKQHQEETLKKDQDPLKKEKTADELNVSATPKYSSFEQIKKELVILDLERKIAWEELMSVKHEYKEDLAPSNFVEPALKTVGVLSGLILVKNIIFGR